MNIQWEAQAYAKNFGFVPQYGEELLDLLDCPPGSPVIDLGCGNGTLTAKIAQMGYDVMGVDSSLSMIEEARKICPNVRFVLSDALDFTAHQSACAIFSNAVFHWIDAPLHDRLLANIVSSLKAGGQLIAEFGGHGNAETVHAALERCFAKRSLAYLREFYFPTLDEYMQRLDKAGLVAAYAAIFPRWTKVTSVADWTRMFVKRPFAGMDDNLRDEIIDEAQSICRQALYDGEGWHVDYVRLRFKAFKRMDGTPS